MSTNQHAIIKGGLAPAPSRTAYYGVSVYTTVRCRDYLIFQAPEMHQNHIFCSCWFIQQCTDAPVCIALFPSQISHAARPISRLPTSLLSRGRRSLNGLTARSRRRVYQTDAKRLLCPTAGGILEQRDPSLSHGAAAQAIGTLAVSSAPGRYLVCRYQRVISKKTRTTKVLTRGRTDLYYFVDRLIVLIRSFQFSVLLHVAGLGFPNHIHFRPKKTAFSSCDREL